MFRAALVLAAVVLQGCASMYVYPEAEISREEGAGSRLSQIVMGVEASPERFHYGWAGTPQAPYDLQTLIDALNEHQVFAQVAYTHQLKTTPHLILKNYRHAKPDLRGVHGEHGGPLCFGIGYSGIWVLSLGILPIYCSTNEQVSFTVSRPNAVTETTLTFTRYHKLLLSSWAPVVAIVNPNWRSTSTRSDSEKRKAAESELAKRYKKFVAQRFLELEPKIVEVLVNNQ